MKRADFVAACLTLKGAKFHHQGRTRRAVDCLGLIVLPALWLGHKLETEKPRYSRIPNPRVLLERLKGVADPVPAGRAGDLVVFSWDEKRIPAHFGVLLDDGRFLHTNAKVSKVQVEQLAGWLPKVHSFWQLTAVED